ncbi:MAG TPA: lactonase family protein [Terriglobia bacterium]|nr:lactonase family protein [Terriglobia bacterium]
MPPEQAQQGYGPIGGSSRREFLKGAAALAVAGRALGRGLPNQSNSGRRSMFAYVGTYSSPEGPEGSRGNGQGIYLFEVDPSSGSLSQRAVFRDDSNPSWIAFDPSKTHVYAGNETQTFQGAPSGSVSAFSIDRASGHLERLNTVSSEGAGPAYLSVHPSGKFVLVANYGGGTIAVLSIQSNGELGPATYVHHDHGPIGPIHAISAPPGSFAISGHDGPHPHMIHADPSGRFVVSTDLGMDQIFVWKFDAQNGKLSEASAVSVPPGDGPRHFVFHPNGRWMYSAQEEGSTVMFWEYDGAAGRLTAKQTHSSLPEGFAGTNFPSEIRMSPDGKFLYAANRLRNSIVCFSITNSGALSYASDWWTRGDYPRSFTIDPTGSFLYVCNQRSDSITAFRIERENGNLTFTGRYTPVGTPAVMVFLT